MRYPRQPMGVDSIMDYITVNNGINMPLLGYGTYRVIATESIEKAIRCGYRLIDTAQRYGNERAVGEGIMNSRIPRETLYITTKVWFL